MAEPTIQEASRLLDRLLSAGTIRRLDMLHESLCHSYRLGALDERKKASEDPPGDGCEN
jgi:hypothetical protein